MKQPAAPKSRQPFNRERQLPRPERSAAGKPRSIHLPLERGQGGPRPPPWPGPAASGTWHRSRGTNRAPVPPRHCLTPPRSAFRLK